MTISPTDREKLDHVVLSDIGKWSHKATYVIRNSLELDKQGIFTTAQVLRSCRRLEAKGLIIQSDHTSYMVMKVWEITPAGRAALAQGGGE